MQVDSKAAEVIPRSKDLESFLKDHFLLSNFVQNASKG